MSKLAEKGYNFVKEVAQLTSNVKTLQDQMARALDQIEKSRDEIRDLQSDMRVLEKEIQVKAIETVMNAHAQLIERVLKLEQVVDDTSSFLTKAPRKKGPLADGRDEVESIQQDS